ncbi:MAG: hypothetical protein R2733_21110 [Acidimicrobiales bacterium]
MTPRHGANTARVADRSVARRPAATKPKLRVVDHHRLKQAARRRRMGLWVAGAVAVGMFVSALAQAELVRGQQELNQMRQQVADAQAEQARLEREIVMASAPQVVVERARNLGMVRATEPQYFPAVRAIED